LFDALGALPADGRRCLVLYHVVGLPVDVIANIEQVAVVDVHTVLARSYDKLLGGIREARATGAGTAGKAGSGAERLAAMSAWDEDKSAALRSLVAELASSVGTPGVSTIVRRAGSQNRATSAAAIAVLAVGALGGVTIAVSAIGEPAASTPMETAVAAPPTTAPVLLPAEPLATPTPTRTRSPIARPRVTTRPAATTTTTRTTTTPVETSESTATAEPEPSSERSSGAD
jgi:hypothetical protein